MCIRDRDITEALWGSKVSPATISELNKKAYVHIEDWRNRPLQGGKLSLIHICMPQQVRCHIEVQAIHNVGIVFLMSSQTRLNSVLDALSLSLIHISSGMVIRSVLSLHAPLFSPNENLWQSIPTSPRISENSAA